MGQIGHPSFVNNQACGLGVSAGLQTKYPIALLKYNMRNFPRIVCAALVMALNIASAHAQLGTAATPQGVPLEKLDKATNKEWKRKLKTTGPAEFKKMSDDNTALLAEREQLLKEKTAMQAKFQVDQEELAKLKASMDAAMAPAANTEDATKEAYEARSKDVAKGVIFKVQIGAFRNRDLSKYLDNSPNFTGETDFDGARKYTLGYFGDYWEADQFKKYLREMGVHDAWTVAYRDGKRVPLRDVLEGAPAEGVGMN